MLQLITNTYSRQVGRRSDSCEVLHASQLFTLLAAYAVALLQTRSQHFDIAKREETRQYVEAEDATSLCTDDAAFHRRRQPHAAHNLAVKAVERAHLRYKRRTHVCSGKEPHMLVTDELATDGVWAELPVTAVVQQPCTQPRLDR